MLVPRTRQIRIKITYETKVKKNIDQNMSQNPHKRSDGKHKFICSVCLNTRVNENRVEGNFKSKSCPLCDRNRDKHEEPKENDSEPRHRYSMKEIKAKDDKKHEPQLKLDDQNEISLGLNLLNEVLSVFQNNKKADDAKEKKSVVKDVAVETDPSSSDYKLKLGVSKTLQLSIGEGTAKDSGASSYSVVNVVYPENYKRSFTALPKNKSASIPQMKLEEMKHALKQRTKSKDTIEEVNRMFATVKKLEKDDDSNRPMIRNGPRVLPLVKTPILKDTEELHRVSSFNEKDVKESNRHCCQICRLHNVELSGGDSNRDKASIKERKRENSSSCQHQRKLLCECCQNHCNVTQFVCCSHYEPNCPS